jgi:hypothetical protein
MAIDFIDGGSFPSGLIHNRFTTHNETPPRQLLAWRDRLGHILDVPIARAQMANGFRGTIESYRIKDLMFLDCRTDPLLQARPVARISTDNMCDYVFHVLMEGCNATGSGLKVLRIRRPNRIHISGEGWARNGEECNKTRILTIIA